MNIGLIHFILALLVLSIYGLLRLGLALKRLKCRHTYKLSKHYTLDENGCLVESGTYICTLCGKETTNLK